VPGEGPAGSPAPSTPMGIARTHHPAPRAGPPVQRSPNRTTWTPTSIRPRGQRTRDPCPSRSRCSRASEVPTDLCSRELILGLGRRRLGCRRSEVRLTYGFVPDVSRGAGFGRGTGEAVRYSYPLRWFTSNTRARRAGTSRTSPRKARRMIGRRNLPWFSDSARSSETRVTPVTYVNARQPVCSNTVRPNASLQFGTMSSRKNARTRDLSEPCCPPARESGAYIETRMPTLAADDRTRCTPPRREFTPITSMSLGTESSLETKRRWSLRGRNSMSCLVKYPRARWQSSAACSRMSSFTRAAATTSLRHPLTANGATHSRGPREALLRAPAAPAIRKCREPEYRKS